MLKRPPPGRAEPSPNPRTQTLTGSGRRLHGWGSWNADAPKMQLVSRISTRRPPPLLSLPARAGCPTTPARRPQRPASPRLTCSGGRSASQGAPEPPQGRPASARTWLRDGDPSGAAPSPAGAREPPPPRCLRGGDAAAPPRASAGLGASRRPPGPSPPPGAGGGGWRAEGGGGPPPARVHDPPRSPRAARSPQPAARTCPGRSRAAAARSVVATPGDGGRPGPPPAAPRPAPAAGPAAPLSPAASGPESPLIF